MSAADARTLIKQRTEHVAFILGRPKTKSNDMPTEPAKFVSTGTFNLKYIDSSQETSNFPGNIICH